MSKCHHQTPKVNDSRPADGGESRRRECLNCKHRFSTYERIEQTPLLSLSVTAREEFSQEILRGIVRSGKRPITMGTNGSFAQQVENKIQEITDQKTNQK